MTKSDIQSEIAIITELIYKSNISEEDKAKTPHLVYQMSAMLNRFWRDMLGIDSAISDILLKGVLTKEDPMVVMLIYIRDKMADDFDEPGRFTKCENCNNGKFLRTGETCPMCGKAC